MSYRNKGSIDATVTVTAEPDRSGNYVCNGTNDYVELQAAINDVSNLGGGTVYVKRGTYIVTANPAVAYGNVFLVPRDNVYLKLEKDAVMQEVNPASPAYANLVSLMIYRADQEGPAPLENFTLDGGYWDQDAGDKRSTVDIGSPPPVGTYYNCQGIHFLGDGTNHVRDCFIKNIRLRNVAGKGINFYLSKHCQGWFNDLDYAGYHSALIEGSAGHPEWDSEWCGFFYNDVAHGVQMTAQWNAYHGIWMGNTIHDCVGANYYLFLFDSGKDCRLINNMFWGTGTVTHSVNFEGSYVVGNTFYSPLRYSGTVGLARDNHFFGGTILDIFSGGDDLVIDGNTFHDNSRLDLEGDNLIIKGNLFENTTGRNITLKTGASHIDIAHNLFRSTNGDSAIMAYGTPTLDEISIHDNDFSNCTSTIATAILNNVPHLEIRFNDGYNPVGIVANPFDLVTNRIEISGAAATPNANQDYTINHGDIVISSTDSGNADCAIMVKDPAGNNALQAALSTITYMRVPYQYRINWGAYTGAAPTVTICYV